MKNKFKKILDIFNRKNIIIIDYSKLKEYIEFCLEYDKKIKMPLQTEHHHILPKSLFAEYTNLKENSWNGAHLLHKDHYIAHQLLVLSLDNFEMRYAFQKMSEKILLEKNTNVPEYFQHIKEKTIKENALKRKEKILKLKEEGKYDDWKNKWNSKRQKSLNKISKNNKTVRENALEKRSENISKKFLKNGRETTIAIETSKKGVKTRKKLYVNKDGEVTNKLKEAGKKCKETLKELVYDEAQNKIVTRQEKRNFTRIKNNERKAKKYKLMHTNGRFICITIKRELDKISSELYKKSKDNYLYSTLSIQEKMKKAGKERFIGLYVEEVPSKDISFEVYDDFQIKI